MSGSGGGAGGAGGSAGQAHHSHGTDQPAAAPGGAAAPPSADAGKVTGGSTAAPAAGSGGTSNSAPVAQVTVIATRELATPTDLDFNPYVADELWVVNHADASATIISNASSDSRSVLRRQDPEGQRHFMPYPTGIAFGGRDTTIVDAQGKPVIGTFATCHESPEDFMGPTLWTSDLRIFGISKEDRAPPFNGPDTGAEGPGSHIDMLHRTPACTGIAWEGAGNVYWTFSGTNSMFVRYDFAKDHGIGNDDHSDGSEWRYPVKGVAYVANTPSALAYDADAKKLYMADTGNGRVITFDPTSASAEKPMSSSANVDDLQVAMDMSGATVTELVPSSYGLQRPSGVALHDQHLFVTDNATSIIHIFTLGGAPVAKLTIPDVSAGGLAGLTFGPDGKLYFVDMAGSRVLRLENAL